MVADNRMSFIEFSVKQIDNFQRHLAIQFTAISAACRQNHI